MCRHPVDACNIVDSVTKTRCLKTRKGYRPDFALRVLEDLSKIGLNNLIFSVGEAKDLGSAVLQKVRAKSQRSGRSFKPISAFNIDKLWKRFWSVTRAKHRKRWYVIGSSVS